MALGCHARQVLDTFRNPWLLLLILGIVHLVAPFIVYQFGVQLFGADSPYVIGMVLFTIIPLGISSIIWVGIARGHVALTLSLVVIDTLLAPLIITGLLKLYFGAQISLDYWQLLRELTFMIVLPTILGVLVNTWTNGRFHERTREYTLPTTKIAFVLVVMINVAAITPYMNVLRDDLLRIVPVTLAVVLLGYILGFVVCLLPGGRQWLTTVPYLTGIRNISLGIVVGLQYFGPLAAVPVVLAILVQQPIATINHWLLRKLR